MSMKKILFVVALVGAAASTSTAGSDPRVVTSAKKPSPSARQAAPRDAVESGIYYAGCDEVRARGKAPLYAGQPGYRVGMDGDRDGIACEPIRGGRR